MEKKPGDIKLALENVDGWGDDELQSPVDFSSIESRKTPTINKGIKFAEELVFLRRQMKVNKRVLKKLRQSLDEQLEDFKEPTLIPEVHAQEEYIINVAASLDTLYRKKPLNILRNKRGRLLSLAEKYEALGKEMDESANTRRWDLYYPLGAAYCSSTAAKYFECAETSRDNAEFTIEEMEQLDGKVYTK